MVKKSLAVLFSCALLSSCSSFYQFVNISPSDRLKEISFSKDVPNTLYEFYYSDTLGNEYLRELKNKYNLQLIADGEISDIGKIKNILDWTNRQWEHNGSNNPTKQDALTILKEAHEGKQFRCVEYGIVATAALNSIGIPARTLGLKTRDVEKVMRGAGHVVTEAYSEELDKWIFIDPQFNIIPVLNGYPLNGIEFQKEIFNKNDSLKLINKQGELTKEDSEQYIKWVGKYLFYFDVLFDQKTLNAEKFKAINGMTKITLVPVGYQEPRIFQRRSKIDFSYYTHSLNDFYRKPK
ncbi:MAG: transglutaminase-like domain-containing protein [Prolixibacteraceae bacterium]